MIPYIEILEYGKVKHRFKKILSDISFGNELMSVPTISIDVPYELLPYIQGRKEIRIITENRVFYGHTEGIMINPTDSGFSLEIKHIVNEWNYRQVPTNYAVKNKTIKKIYQDEEMIYGDDWNIDSDISADKETIDYVYSRQTKLDALTKTCELTQDIFWRVPFSLGKQIEIGSFGKELNYYLSTKQSGYRNIRILDEPEINIDFSNVINIATVYSSKSDTGMSSMTLREVYNDKSLQNPNFPVVILRNNINNERHYPYIEFPKLAPNNQFEYSVIDTESVALESGLFIEGTFAFEDLSPFSLEEKQEDDETETTGVWLPQDFISEYNGKELDADENKLFESVDVFKEVLKILGYENYKESIGGDNLPYNIWNNRSRYSEYFDVVSSPEFGDFAIWGITDNLPYSHIAMVVSTTEYFGQNQPYPYCNVAGIKQEGILGYLRVKSEYWIKSESTDKKNGVHEVTEEDIIKCSKMVYDTAIKKLINGRRKFEIQVKTEKLPKDINVGDKILLNYSFDEYMLSECSNYMRKLINSSNWYYITKIGINIDKSGIETGELTLEKFLRIDRKGKQES